MRKIYLLALLSTLALTLEVDVNTFSNYLEVQNTHLHLEWFLNLDKQYINGTAQYDFVFSAENVQQISLDIYQLSIYYAYDVSTGAVLKHFIDYPYKDSNQGERLNLVLPRVYHAKETLKIRIKYSIDTRSRAISFMTKEQTSTKTHPYIFSQCEDANCRALAPLQDTPAIKQTYTATVMWENVWEGGNIDVFMSAVETEKAHQLIGTYIAAPLSVKYFQQENPIPSYLIAIVAGNLKKVSTGPRTYVISEPDQVDGYAQELEDMEGFLAAIEKYIGPYTWGDYTLVIQPPSFPIGGMENPLLTFANPTIMTKSKSKSGLAVAIHEMAHSWFGNTITCVNWSNMWINEGFTVFLERKASYIFYSKDNQQTAFDRIQIDATTGNSGMQDDMLEYGMTNSFSSIHPDTVGINPDDTFSKIPYEKGFQFLTYLESITGAELFQSMLKQYLIVYRWKSIGENDFKQFLLKFMTTNNLAKEKLDKIDNEWNSWVYQPGLPPVKLDFSTQAITDANNLAAAYIAAKGTQPAGWDTYTTYLPNQKHIFLQYLIDHVEEIKATPTILTQIDTDHKLTTEDDSEIKYRWFRTCLLAGDQTRNAAIEVFLATTGRGKMIYPVYKALNVINEAEAKRIFQTNIKFYHPIARNNIQKILYGVSTTE